MCNCIWVHLPLSIVSPLIPRPDRMTRPEMDPADYTKQLTVIEKLLGKLDIKTNVKEMLQVIAEFNRHI